MTDQQKVAPLEMEGGDDAPAEGEMREAEKFDHPAEYWLACIGYAVGFGNIWRFPYMAYTMGGAAFLIPYLISLFLIAMPMYMIETLFGQLIRTKLNERYGTIHMAFWGVAITQLCVGFFTVIYYVTLMAWSFALFFDSWKDPFPWVMTKEQLAAKQKLIDANPAKYKGIEASNIWNPDYFYKDTLNRSASIGETGTLNGHLVFCMFLSYFLIYFSAWKGVKSTGKMVWVTCTAPYVILTVLLIKGLTLDGMGQGLKYLVIPRWSRIGDIEVWKSAAIQILFSSGVAFGPLMYYGGSRSREEKIVTASFWIPMANSATSFYAALTVFTFVGHVAKVLNLPVDQVTTQSVSLAFVAYPGLINLLAGKNFWAVIFFLMLVTLGVDSAFGYVDYIMEFFLDAYPVILTKMRKEVVCIILCVVCFICSLMFVTDAGYYVFGMFDAYACGVSLFFCLIMECIVIGWVFGIEKLAIICKRTTDEDIPKVVIYLLKFFIPLFTFINIILYFITEFS